MLLDLHSAIYGGVVVVAPDPTYTPHTKAVVVHARLQSAAVVVNAGKSSRAVIINPNNGS